MTLAIGKLMDPETGAKLGTVFAVTGRLALTAFHCVEDRESGRVRCEWPGAISHAVVEDGDRENDVALLRLDAELPQKLDPVRLATDVTEHARFSAPGNPAAVGGASLFAISGEVTWLEGALGGVSVMQLASPESAAELSLHGMSGTPVLVGQPLRAVGVIRWNSPRHDRPELAAGGAAFATPAATVLRRWPQLDLSHAAEASDLRRLLRHITQRSSGRNGIEMRTNVCELLLAGDLGLSEHDLTIDKESAREKQHYIVIRRARVVIKISEDIGADDPLESGERWIETYLSARMNETSYRHLGILTDGAEWRLYHLMDDKLHQVGAAVTVGESESDPGKLLAWLEAVLATRQQIIPTPNRKNANLDPRAPSMLLTTPNCEQCTRSIGISPPCR